MGAWLICLLLGHNWLYGTKTVRNDRRVCLRCERMEAWRDFAWHKMRSPFP